MNNNINIVTAPTWKTVKDMHGKARILLIHIERAKVAIASFDYLENTDKERQAKNYKKTLVRSYNKLQKEISNTFKRVNNE